MRLNNCLLLIVSLIYKTFLSVGKVSNETVIVRLSVLPTITKREKMDILKITSQIMSASVNLLFICSFFESYFVNNCLGKI